jgi:hypothetical protein
LRLIFSAFSSLHILVGGLSASSVPLISSVARIGCFAQYIETCKIKKLEN